jgi:hypothetical protein
VVKLLFPTLGPVNPGGPTALETFHTRGVAVLCRESSGDNPWLALTWTGGGHGPPGGYRKYANLTEEALMKE